MTNQILKVFIVFVLINKFKNKKMIISVKSHLIKFLILIVFPFVTINANQHPGLFLTPKAVKEIKSALGKYPAFDQSVSELRKTADEAIYSDIVVPVPKDGGGGYTHEKHKNNYYQMNAAGIMFQLTGNKKYAQFVHDMLMKYADLYPTLGIHPLVKSEVPGKLFWQTLNESVWLVHTANAYDCVYSFINETDRNYIEKNLFYPMAEFISNGNPANYAVFNKMHNHGTWATAAVGMIGYAMENKNLVEQALYGSKKDGKTGFVRQLDVLFSPDGYFTEGPYYQRYAIWPFMTFAQVIENQQPELKIFAHRDSILLKAVNVLVQCAYNGEIFFLNDALTKTYKTQEIVYAVDIAYKNNPANKQLLDIARQQDSYIVTGEGLATAKAVSKKKNIIPFKFKSVLLRDGQDGKEGGVAVLRNGIGSKQMCLILKATSHGLSHGHYDKLSVCLYDNGNKILTDYGAARFLNIEPKSGGGYTKENHTFAAQTIAHNTVTVDEASDFNGNFKESSAHHSDIQYCDFQNPDVQVISAAENNAYKNVGLKRTTAIVNTKEAEFPFIIDIFKINSASAHQLDLPFYYEGQLVSTSFKYTKYTNELKPLGEQNGYQHLWLEATGKPQSPVACFTFVNGTRFYSISTLTDDNTELMLTRIGANDPDFNLRNDPAYMIRQKETANHTFVSIVEPHGLYDLSREVTSGFTSNIQNIIILSDNDEYTAISFTTTTNKSYLFVTLNKGFDANKMNNLDLNGKKVSFMGNFYFEEIKNK